MVAPPGYTSPEHVVKQADISALQGIYKRYGDKSFDLMIEAIYRFKGKEAAGIFAAVAAHVYSEDLAGKIKDIEDLIEQENRKVLY